MATPFKRLLASTVVASLVSLGSVQTAQATLIGTQEIAAAQQASRGADTPAFPEGSAKARLSAQLDRGQLAQMLEQRGVDREAVKARIAALTDEEAAALAQKIDQLPAGAGILEVVFVLFIILLVTDILGLTKVFPFTRGR